MGAVAAPNDSKAFGILGPLEVRVAGADVMIQGGRRRALLARLLVSVNQVVSADRLIEDLWGDALPAQPLNALQACVSYLRSVLEATRAARGPATVLLTREPGYLLRVSDDELDALRFGALIHEGRRALRGRRMEEAAERFERALLEWRGLALAGFADEPWAAVEAARLEELRAAAIEDGIEARLAMGLHHVLVGELEAAVATHPLRERLRAQFMLALYRCGRQAEALRAFGDLRRILGDELGIEPSADLRRLEESILLQKPDLDWHPLESAQLVLDRPVPPNPSNLRAPISSFVGRRAERTTLRGLLEKTRLLTLTGPGGVGKTRLALQLGVDVLAEHPDGVWIVELASTSDPSLVSAHVRASIGLGEEIDSPPLVTIARHLRLRQALLVLDNCEHLIEPCAALADELLRTCPRLKILATSRERLRVDGETTWAVPSLSLPQRPALAGAEPLAPSDAAQLLVERVGAARGGRPLSEADESAVVEICQRLDGIPLALELAAARANVLALPEIAARLGDRFALLTAGSRSSTRHGTLRAAVDWTYDALAEPERRLFERVSVFAGGFTLDAAEQVCAGSGIGPADVLGLLAALTDKSVVSATERAGTSRYAMLETLRQYGAEKLHRRGETEQLGDAHLAWAVSFGEAAEAELSGPHVRRSLEALDDEYDNLQAALAWAESRGRHGLGVRLAVGIRLYWDMRARVGEARVWLGRMLAAESDIDPALMSGALAAASSMAFVQADGVDAERLAEESLATAERMGSDRDIGRASLALGNALAQQVLGGSAVAGQPKPEIGLEAECPRVPADDLRRATLAYERALALARRESDRFTSAMALLNLGYLAMCEGDLARARPLLEESLALRRDLGNPAFVGRSLSFLGLAAHREGRLDDAERFLAESVATLREVGDNRGLRDALRRHADVLRAAKDYRGAAHRYREASSLAARSGLIGGMIACIVRAGEAAVLAGDRADGGYLLGAAQALLSTGGSDSADDIDHLERHRLILATLREELGDHEFSLAFDKARTLSVDEALLYLREVV